MVFVVGLLLGALVTLAIVGWLLLRSTPAAPDLSYRTRSAIADIERRTIHDLVAESLTADRSRGPKPNSGEGQAIELRRRW